MSLEDVSNNATTEGKCGAFRVLFKIGFRGQMINIEVVGDKTVEEVTEHLIDTLPEKMRKETTNRHLYLKDTGIFLPPRRTVDSFLLPSNSSCELEFKKKGKKALSLSINFCGRIEVVELTASTLVQGAIQLLSRHDTQDDFCTLWTRKGRLCWHDKVGSHLKRDEVPECRVIPEAVRENIRMSSFTGDKKGLKNNFALLKFKGSSSSLGSPTYNTPTSMKRKLAQWIDTRPSELDLKKKNILVEFNPETSFAAPMAIDSNVAIPLKTDIFFQLGDYIMKHLHLLGIFRVSGDTEDVKSLYFSFQNAEIDWSFAQDDPFVVTSALKMYLRKQQDPLIPFTEYKKWIVAQQLTDPKLQISAFKAAFQQLPSPNNSILSYLMYLLSKVAERSEENKMTARNLSVVFGPTIMWDPNPKLMDYSSTTQQSALVESLVKNYASIWGPDGASSASPSEADLVSVHASVSPLEKNSGSQLLTPPKRPASACVLSTRQYEDAIAQRVRMESVPPSLLASSRLSSSTGPLDEL